MNKKFTRLLILLLIHLVSIKIVAQDSKKNKVFKPVEIIKNIDKPEGMAVIGDMLYISQYHQNGSIIKYDISRKLVSGKVTDGLNYPTGLIAIDDKLYVLEYGTGSLLSVNPENNKKELITTGFSRPADLILFDDNLLVSDFGRGTIYAVNLKTFEKSVFASGLANPAGMAVLKGQVHVVEWAMGRISKINNNGEKEILVSEGLSSPWGLMVYENELYVAENGSNQISKILEIKIPIGDVRNSKNDKENSSFQDSISVWKAVSMNCEGLSHPEAFSVSDRGIYVSEWNSKEVSEIILNSPPSGTLLLSGKSKLGNTLTAEPQNIQDEDGLGSFSYRWQIADFPDSEKWVYMDGKKNEHKLKNESFVGKFIRAELSYIDQRGFNEYIFSNAKEILRTYPPVVSLTLYPDKIFLPGDTVTLIANVNVYDEDAKHDKVEFFSNDVLLMTLNSEPYSYSFVIQDNQTANGYIDQLSISAKGYDTNGAFGKDEMKIYITDNELYEAELNELLNIQDDEIRIFPNPTDNIVNIIKKNEQLMNVQLINMNKVVVMSALVSSNIYSLDVSKIPAGMYILQYNVGNETRAEKIIKL